MKSDKVYEVISEYTSIYLSGRMGFVDPILTDLTNYKISQINATQILVPETSSRTKFLGFLDLKAAFESIGKRFGMLYRRNM